MCLTHRTRVALLLACLASPAAAQPPLLNVAPLVNDQTFLVARVDLKQLDLQKATEWVQDLLARNGLPEDMARPMSAGMGMAATTGEQYVTALTQAGVQQAGVVLDLDDQGRTHLAIVLPKPNDLELVRKSVRPLIDTAVGDLVVLTLPGEGARVSALKPAARDALTAPLAAKPDAVVVAAYEATDAVKKQIESWPKGPREARDERVEMIGSVQKVDAVIDVRTEPRLTGRVEFDTTEAAAAFKAAAAPAAKAPFDATTFVRTLVATLGGQVQGNALTVDARQPQFEQVAKATVPGLLRARVAANRVKSASNLRMLMQGTMILANDRKGRVPASLDEIVTGADIPRSVLTNPTRPELKDGGYVYVPPGVDTVAKIKGQSERVAMYEDGEFGEGLNVAFWDGHVEFVSDKARFDAMLEAAEKPAP